MAVEPLFNEDRETLLNRVRIETADDAQTIALIDMAISEVRIGIYRAITSARATTIAGYALVDNPTTEEQILRAGGANTEALYLTWLLAQRLPFLFMDNRASTGDAWNDEQLTRDSAGIQEFLDELKGQIDLGLGDLMEPVSEDSGPNKASSIGPDDTYSPFSPFKGLYPLGTNYGVQGGR